MKKFPANIKFKHNWRSYQAQLFDDIKDHLSDNHLNLVAAPGSGKTVVGLEVMRQINTATIILVPSIALRHQWIQRFTQNFCDFSEIPDWISEDLKNPKFMTVTTYQALHSIMSSSTENRDKFLVKISELSVKTVILDEAHHLRSAWWRSLMSFKTQLKNPKTVSLTATPPYDVSSNEWEKYKNLCGSIDAEISVPELVKAKNLCPHQDFIYLNRLTNLEQSEIEKFNKKVQLFESEILNSREVLGLIQQHDFFNNEVDNLSEILDNSDYFLSMAVLLKKQNFKISRKFFKIMGFSRWTFHINYSLKYLEIFLSNFLWEDFSSKPEFEKLQKNLKQQLNALNLINHHKVHLQEDYKNKNLGELSTKKLSSINSIIELESDFLKNKLRLVILADYVRKEFLNQKIARNIPLKLGIIPIFLEVVNNPKIKTNKIGVLTGSIIIIPKLAKKSLYEILKTHNFSTEDVKLKSIKNATGFYQLEFSSSANKEKVAIITNLFMQGDIEILVGTQALLGEGWDAPVINTLILASTVSSFMLSNQMRGRAIRTNPQNPHKTSNIWHLASISINSLSLGCDFENIKKRFKTFSGIFPKKQVIENRIDRLDLGIAPFSNNELNYLNKKTAEKAKNRELTKDAWAEILSTGQINKIIPEIEFPKNHKISHPVTHKTIRGVLGSTLILSILFNTDFWSHLGLQFSELTPYPHVQNLLESFAKTARIVFSIILIFYLPRFIMILKSIFKYGYLGSQIYQMARVILDLLIEMQEIHTDKKDINIEINIDKKSKNKQIYLSGVTLYESNVFIDTFEELFNPDKNPKYILIKNHILEFLKAEVYYPVPKIIGQKKKFAQKFAKLWKKYVDSNTKLIYTRSKNGRQKALKAKNTTYSFSLDYKKLKIIRKNIWK